MRSVDWIVARVAGLAALQLRVNGALSSELKQGKGYVNVTFDLSCSPYRGKFVHTYMNLNLACFPKHLLL